MTYCQSCGAENDPGRFGCYNCHAKLDGIVPAATKLRTVTPESVVEMVDELKDDQIIHAVIAIVAGELYRAQEKHPEWPGYWIDRAAIVGEESGELLRAALQHAYEGAPKQDMLTEAVQVGAMALRFIITYVTEDREG